MTYLNSTAAPTPSIAAELAIILSASPTLELARAIGQATVAIIAATSADKPSSAAQKAARAAWNDAVGLLEWLAGQLPSAAFDAANDDLVSLSFRLDLVDEPAMK